MADYLYRSRTTTSVWNKGDGSEDVVKTLQDAGTPAFVAYGPEVEYVDINPRDRDKFLHIQLVKRNGEYTVLVDGFRQGYMEKQALEVPVSSDACAGGIGQERGAVVSLKRHKGIERDKSTQSSIFSPCAVSVLLEDGEVAPQECTVRLVQALVYGKKNRHDIISRVVLGASDVEPTRLDGFESNCVFLPIPARFTRPPYIVIVDTTRIKASRALKYVGPAFWYALIAGYKLISVKAGMGASGLSAIAYATILSIGGAGAGIFASFLVAVGVVGYNLVYKTPTEPAIKDSISSTGDLVKQLVNRHPEPEPGRLRLKLNEMTRILTSLASFVSSNDSSILKSNELRNEWIVWSWLQASQWYKYSSALERYATEFTEAENALREVTEQKARVDASQDQAAINEVDRNLKAAQERMRVLSNAETTEAEQQTFFERWLKPAPGSILVDNFMDIENLNFDVVTAVDIEIDLEIRDVDCSKATQFTFVCDNNTKSCTTWGAMAYDMRSAIEKLWAAIECFEQKINDAADGRAGSWIGGYFQATLKYYAMISGDKGLFAAAAESLKEIEGSSIRAIVNQIDKKLWNNFGGKDRKAGKLLSPEELAQRTPNKLEKLYDNLLKLEKLPADRASTSAQKVVGTRQLPHVVYGKTLFPSVQAIQIGESDVQTSEAIVKQSSDINAAVQEVSRSIHTGLIALNALRDDWERSGARCRFIHAVDPDAINTKQKKLLHTADRSYMMTLTRPVDVFSEVTADTVPEEPRRYMDMVQTASKWLKTLGIASVHQDHLQVALSFFAQLYTDEILSDYLDVGGVTAAVNYALLPSHVRARNRVNACVDLLLSATKRPNFGFYKASDVLFTSTGPGRDLALLTKLLHVPSTCNVYMIKYMRNIAVSLKNFADGISLKITKVPMTASTIPSEPLNSIFHCFSSGVHALHRVGECIKLYVAAAAAAAADQRRISTLSNLVIYTVRASYPSLQLASESQIGEVSLPGPQPFVFVCRQNTHDSIDRQGVLLARIAGLRINPIVGGVSEIQCDANESKESVIESLVDEFTRFNTSGLRNAAVQCAVYNIPFAYGSYWPFRSNAEQVMMFGSIPVFTRHLLWAFDGLLSDGYATRETECDSVSPVYAKCVGPESERNSPVLLKHPDWVCVDSKPGTGVQNVDPSVGDTDSSTGYTGPFLVKVFASSCNSKLDQIKEVFDDKHARLSTTVSSMAWNSERVLQALLVCAAYRGVDVKVCITLDAFDQHLQSEFLASAVIGVAMAREVIGFNFTCTIVGVQDAGIRDMFTNCRSLFAPELDQDGGIRRNAPTSVRFSEACALVGMCMNLM